MVHNCVILSCPLHNRRNIRKGLLFHSFPVDQHRFELWRQIVLNHCPRTVSINKHSKICHRHFHPDDYIANHTGLTRYLKATAIPSIFSEIHSSHPMSMTIDSDDNRTETSSFPSLTLLPMMTNTKTKRLLTTIDKLHQIQSANKNLISRSMSLGTEQIKGEEQREAISDESTIPTNLNDHLLSTSQSSVINQEDSTKSANPSSAVDCETLSWTNNSIKNQLEDKLFKFLQQANLLQYYPAFIEQGGDDLKQLAEAQNEDFQEIITLVGMASKPLHVKRFKKALLDYRQSLNGSDEDPILFNINYPPAACHRSSPITDEMCPSQSYRSSLLDSKTKMNPSKLFNKFAPNKNLNTYQLIDDSQRKLIADEAERLANLLPAISVRKINGRNQIAKDLFATMNLPRDFEDRWQRIRKFSAIYNRFDSKRSDRMMTSYEILINEAAAAICFHRPEFLTRRDELFHLARRVLQNIGISNSPNISQKRPLSMLTCESSAAKQVKLNIPILKTPGRQRDSDSFRLLWHNRETKLTQIPIEMEALRCEQNKLLQQLKQNTIDPSTPANNIELKRQIDELGKQIEQLTDEERNLRRLIRKRNMRIQAKERQQQKQMTTNASPPIENLILPITSSPLTNQICLEQLTSSVMISSLEKDLEIHPAIAIKTEKLESSLPRNSSADFKVEKELSMAPLIPKPIERRREEVNERLIPFRRTSFSTSRQRSSSSSTIMMESSIESNSQLTKPITRFPVDFETEIVETKNLIQQLDTINDRQRENDE